MYIAHLVDSVVEYFISSARNVLSDEERGETDVFAGYLKFSMR